MKENSYSRNQKKKWMEGQFIGESSRKGIEIWEGLTHKDKRRQKKMRKNASALFSLSYHGTEFIKL